MYMLETILLYKIYRSETKNVLKNNVNVHKILANTWISAWDLKRMTAKDKWHLKGEEMIPLQNCHYLTTEKLLEKLVQALPLSFFSFHTFIFNYLNFLMFPWNLRIVSYSNIIIAPHHYLLELTWVPNERSKWEFEKLRLLWKKKSIT